MMEEFIATWVVALAISFLIEQVRCALAGETFRKSFFVSWSHNNYPGGLCLYPYE
jgi:hypothetical protein